MTIKTIIFDLDGVLLDAKEIHYETLNKAIETIAGKEFIITRDEHLSTYDGLKTVQKLCMLTENKNLAVNLHQTIWHTKQCLTMSALDNLQPNTRLINMFASLKEIGIKNIICASNSIQDTVYTSLKKLGIFNFFTLILSNESVKNSKPHPEMYWLAMTKADSLPEETLILEDSPYGLLAASRSGANVLRINNLQEVNLTNIMEKINKLESANQTNTPKWTDSKLNILIPMSGAGSRFANAGYTFPKPLIEVNGKPMIQVVVENLNIEANYIYVVLKEHRQKYNLDTLLNLITPGCKIVETDSITQGAACTALLAKEYIDNDMPLFFANSDQFVDWDSIEFMYKMQESKCDGGIVTFKATHPKRSFVKTDNAGFVTEVAEKNPISDKATVGFYYRKYGADFVKYAEQMIEKDIRVNNEYYVCPVFNEAIQDGKKIKTYEAKKMQGLGTPEDLNEFLSK